MPSGSIFLKTSKPGPKKSHKHFSILLTTNIADNNNHFQLNPLVCHHDKDNPKWSHDLSNLTRVDLISHDIRSDCNQDANYAEEMKFKRSKIENADITSSVICARAKKIYEMFRKIEDNWLKENLSCSIAFYPNQEWYEFRRRENRNKLIINLSTNLMN